MKTFVLTQKAKSDLKEIAKFTESRWGKKQRNFYLKQFDDAFHLLARQPEIAKSCDDIRDGYLKFLQGSHVIFFKLITEKKIEIVRILHKNMDIDTRLNSP
ncbi:type II toxin-antitoxin system RelE/ParE family toxin [Endozoicomonas lisbonensis]|uniref:Toxin n=1 Tax=Endozoicomonas lisbonensis TaxID=3120522 RepID=A0ABV2SP84_9GAMM